MLKTCVLPLLAAAALLAGGSAAYAGNIVLTFDDFAMGPFSSGTENGFTITGTNSYVWPDSSMCGYCFPTQSIGADGADTADSITFDDGSTFDFVSLDIISPFGSEDPFPPILAAGYLNSNLVAEDMFSAPMDAGTPQTFDASALAGQTLDTLIVQYASGDLSTPLIDNVTFDPTPGDELGSNAPEPGTFEAAAVAFALAGLIAWGRKRITKR